MKQWQLQPSLAGGELAKALWARVDLAKYKTGFKKGLNFFIHPHGGISNRAGMYLSGICKTSLTKVRPIPMIAANNDSYVLELGDLYMRVWRFGQPVMDPMNPLIPYEVVTPWTAAILWELRFAQSNDVITVTHETLGVREITRFASDNWTVGTVSFTSTFTSPGTPTATMKIVTAGTVSPNYTYEVTAISDSGEESLASNPSNSVDLDLGLSKNLNVITWPAVTDADYFNVYKADNGFYGFIGSTPSLGFVDRNYKADLSQTPPGTYDPFASSVYPIAVTFHNQRRWFGGATTKPQTMWGTKPSNFYSFQKTNPSRDDDGVEFSIAAQDLQKIKHLVSMGDLIAFTQSAEWKITGSKDDIITPSSISAKPQSYYGCSDLRPLVIGTQILFCQSMGNVVRDLAYRFDVDKYTGDDLTIMASHVLEGRTIVDWGFAQTPDSLVICVLSDGTVGCLTYLREHEVWGWTTWETRGLVEGVAVVPEVDRHVAYFTVRRFVGGVERRTLERLMPRKITDRAEGFFLDCGLSYLGVPQNILSWTGQTFTLPAHGFVDGNGMRVITQQRSVDNLEINGHFTVTNATGGTFQLIGDDGAVYTPPTGSQLGMVIQALAKVQVLSGLSHLEGETINVLADGAVIEDVVVSGGGFTLPAPAAIVHAGLPYEALFQSLELSTGEPVGEATIKTVGECRVHVEDTAGIELGSSEDDFVEVATREFELPGYPPELETGVLSAVVSPTPDYAGSVWVRQRYPLPVTLLALLPNVDYAE